MCHLKIVVCSFRKLIINVCDFKCCDKDKFNPFKNKIRMIRLG